MREITAFILFSIAAQAQSIPTINVTSDPSGSCSSERLEFNTTNGKLWGCNSGTWSTQTSTGVVTSVTATSPLSSSGGSSPNISATTSGTGNVCLTNNCVMTTPNLGVPSAIDLTHATNPPTWNQNTTGTAAGLTSYPALCTGNQLSQGLSSGSNNCITPALQLHSITIPISGSPIATGTGSVGLPAPGTTFSCTINKAAISANASGSMTVGIWKANAAIPNSGNLISASAPVTLSSAQLNQNSALTGWTTSVSSGDVFWATVVTADGVLTNATVTLWCQ